MTAAEMAILQRLAARALIHDAQMRYCRGIDRCDADLILSAYWPEAVDHHGIYDGGVDGFVEFVIPHLRCSLRGFHMIGNIHTVFISEDAAEVESYVLSYSERPGQNQTTESLQGGRYLDRFERRGEDWRILERTYVMDWNMNGPSTARWDGPLYGCLDLLGARHPDDPSYAVLPGLS